MDAHIPPTGTLTDRIELKRRVTADEAEGGEVVAFDSIATVWARVKPLTARQAFQADGRGQNITHAVVIRFRTDLKAGDRVVFRGVPMDIEAVSDLNGQRAYLSCQCVARAVTG